MKRQQQQQQKDDALMVLRLNRLHRVADMHTEQDHAIDTPWEASHASASGRFVGAGMVVAAAAVAVEEEEDERSVACP